MVPPCGSVAKGYPSRPGRRGRKPNEQRRGSNRRDGVRRHHGNPIHPHSISQAFERIVARAGVPKIRLHDVRHTHGTLLIKPGVPIKVVSERLGHGNPAFTLDTYQHVVPCGLPEILSSPTAEVLGRFETGGTRLVLTWWGFAMSAVLLAPTAVLVSATLPDANATVLALATSVGILAALVQFLGLIRWPFAVPHLARTAVDPATSAAQKEAIDVTFQTLPRYLGVAVGEHLGYLFTGAWTSLVGLVIIQSEVLHAALGISGLILAPLFVLCSFEFVGSFEPRGWKLAGTLVPITYIAWSLWLIATGIALQMG